MLDNEIPILIIEVPRTDMIWTYFGDAAHYTFQCPIYYQARKSGRVSYGLTDSMDRVRFKFYDLKNLRFLRWAALRYAI